MRLLLLADLHLGYPLEEWGERAGDRREVRSRALVEAVDAALDPGTGVDAVLVAGDLFDLPDPSEDLRDLVLTQLRRLHDGGRPTVILPGNHDSLSHPRCCYPRLDLPESVLVVETPRCVSIEIPVGGETLHLHTMTWIPGRTPDSPWEGLRRTEAPGRHVALLYARLDEDLSPDDPRVPPLIPPAVLERSGLDLAILGRAPRFSERRLGTTTVVSPAALVGGAPEELGERFLVIAELSDSGVSLETRALTQGRIEEIEIDVTRLADEGAVAGRILRQARGVAMLEVRLLGTPSRTFDLAAVARALPEGSPLVSFEDATRIRVKSAAASGDSEDRSLRDMVAEVLETRLASAGSEEERVAIDDALHITLEALGRPGGFHAH